MGVFGRIISINGWVLFAVLVGFLALIYVTTSGVLAIERDEAEKIKDDF